jgi:hypothetical protein
MSPDDMSVGDISSIRSGSFMISTARKGFTQSGFLLRRSFVLAKRVSAGLFEPQNR